MLSIIENCKGCAVNDDCAMHSLWKKTISNELKCPCMHCIVKVICYETCNVYDEAYHDLGALVIK